MKTAKVSEKGVSSGRRPGSPRRTGVGCVSGDPCGWRLPSGEELAEFALHAGFVAPVLLPDLENGSGGLAEEAETAAHGVGHRRHSASRGASGERAGGYR